jgi:hypothetical protein
VSRPRFARRVSRSKSLDTGLCASAYYSAIRGMSDAPGNTPSDLFDLGILDDTNSSEFGHRQLLKSILKRKAISRATDESSGDPWFSHLIIREIKDLLYGAQFRPLRFTGESHICFWLLTSEVFRFKVSSDSMSRSAGRGGCNGPGSDLDH